MREIQYSKKICYHKHMRAYYDYNSIPKTRKKPFGFLNKLAFIAIFSTAVFFHNATELSKPPQTNIGTASAIKTAFSFLKHENRQIEYSKSERVNILFLGIPGAGNNAPNLTDSIILASIKPNTSELALLSIPRDLLVYLPNENIHTKINALFSMNEKNPELIEKKIEEITGQKIDHYAVLDISAVEKIVDRLGGLNVYVKKDIYDTSFPTANFGTEVFKVEKGWRYFDGRTVQKYLRTRHSQDGDFDRMEQQQAVIEALRKKIFGLNLILDLPTILSMANMLSSHIQTDVSENDMINLYGILKNVSYDKIIHKTLAKSEDSPLISGSFNFNGQNGFILKPKAGDFDYTEIQQIANNIFEQ